MSAAKQPPTNRPGNKMPPPPTSNRRFPTAGAQPASGTQSRFRWCREARLALFHTVTATINRDNLSMVKQPIEQCSGKHFIPQESAPLGKTRVGGQDDRAMLIAGRHQLKEVVSLLL